MFELEGILIALIVGIGIGNLILIAIFWKPIIKMIKEIREL